MQINRYCHYYRYNASLKSYEQITSHSGNRYAVVVDEAHSSQSGKSAEKLKAALADTDEALRELAEWEDRSVEELEKEQDRLMLDLLSQGQHNNLSFLCLYRHSKPKTLQTFGILVEKERLPTRINIRPITTTPCYRLLKKDLSRMF